jgi:hypothetical protein
VPAAEGVICRAAALINVIFLLCIFQPVLVIICYPISPPTCALLLPHTPALPPTPLTHQMRLPVLVVMMQRRQSMLGLITRA